MYCIYTNKDVPKEHGSYDHIIPLSLGGNDEFCVWSETALNSDMGSKVDGALAKDPLIMLARRKADARGHSDKPPVPTWKKSHFEGQPVQVSFGDEIKVWDAKSKFYIPLDQVRDKNLTSKLTFKTFARPRFVAKVALGGGYFVFKAELQTTIDCDELRKLLKSNNLTKFATTLRMYDAILPSKSWPTNNDLFRLLCEFRKRTTFLVIPFKDGIAFHVGILGMYVGSIFCPGNTSGLSSKEGEAIILGPGPMERLPLRRFVEEFKVIWDRIRPASKIRTDQK